MLGIRSPAAVRAAVRTLRFSSNYSGCISSSSRTLVYYHSRSNFPRKPDSASDAKTYLVTRNNNRNYRLSSIKLYSTILPSNVSTPDDAAALECSSSVENGGADAESAEAFVPVRNGTMEEAYYAIELALDSVVKIFTVASSPSYFLPWQNKSQRESMGSGLCLLLCISYFCFLCGFWVVDGFTKWKHTTDDSFFPITQFYFSKGILFEET